MLTKQGRNDKTSIATFMGNEVVTIFGIVLKMKKVKVLN
jgi:hypothetical protein